jgi:hypothetical protein
MSGKVLKNIQVQINENIINHYKSYNLSVEHLGSILFILFALYENRIDLLEAFDDSSKEKRALILYDHLIIKGFLDETSNDEVNEYTLTKKALEFIELVNSECEKENVHILPEIPVSIEAEKQITKEAVESVDSWITDWIKLFPEGEINGRYLRINKKECLVKMSWFMQNYEFDKQTIFNATKTYLDTQERGPHGHMYTRNSSYFISKQQGSSKADKVSDLATWCERVANSGEKQTVGASAFDKLI